MYGVFCAGSCRLVLVWAGGSGTFRGGGPGSWPRIWGTVASTGIRRAAILFGVHVSTTERAMRGGKFLANKPLPSSAGRHKVSRLATHFPPSFSSWSGTRLRFFLVLDARLAEYRLKDLDRPDGLYGWGMEAFG